MTYDLLPSLPLVLLVFAIAFLYSSVGFGGASGYLAAMSLFAFSPDLMASTALMLNVLVASIALTTFRRAGHFEPGLLLPFVITSVPAAFVGGYVEIDERIYATLLYLALAYVGIRLLRPQSELDRSNPRPPSRLWMAGAGALIGLISGLLGLGGGIFLSPLIVLAGWGNPAQAAATSAGFILVNSLAGLSGRVVGDQFVFGLLGAALLPVGLVGALLGSRWGAQRLSGNGLRRLLGVVLLLAVVRFFLG